MKNLFLILILSGFFFACSNDDNEIPVEKYIISYNGEPIEMIQYDTISVTFNIDQLVTEDIKYFFNPKGYVETQFGSKSIPHTVIFDNFKFYSNNNEIAGVMKGNNTFQYIPHEILPNGYLRIWISILNSNQLRYVDIPLKVRPDPDFQ